MVQTEDNEILIEDSNKRQPSVGGKHRDTEINIEQKGKEQKNTQGMVAEHH